MKRKEDLKQKPKIGISIGDINGIGPEVIIKTLSDNRICTMFTPVIYGSGKVLAYYKKLLNINQFNYTQVQDINQVQHGKINVINAWNETVEITPGEKNETGGKYAIIALMKAVEDLKNGGIDALTTAPINKDNVQSDQFSFPGHTEYLSHMADGKDHLMFLVHDNLRVGIVSGHVPLNEVSKNITKEAIVLKLKAMLKSLQKDFGIGKPKVAVLGLNPHAGEDGLLGNEENEIIIPAVKELKSGHHIVSGPYSADGFFGMRLQNKFDGVLGMYHDQGLIPFKTLAFDEGVNYTANLPFIRTSPDHGTAFEIAGKNKADETSFRNALYLALDIFKKRSE